MRNHFIWFALSIPMIIVPLVIYKSDRKYIGNLDNKDWFWIIVLLIFITGICFSIFHSLGAILLSFGISIYSLLQLVSWIYILGMIFLIFMAVMFFGDDNGGPAFVCLLIAGCITYNYFDSESIADRKKNRDINLKKEQIISEIEMLSNVAFTNPAKPGTDKLVGKILIVMGDKNGQVWELNPWRFKDMPSEIKTTDFYSASYIAWITPEYRRVGTYRGEGFSCSRRAANIITYHVKLINKIHHTVTFSKSFTGPDPPNVVSEIGQLSTLPEGGFPPDDDVKKWLKTLVGDIEQPSKLPENINLKKAA
jgi:hypothetical protein